jgi:hypothetical protein
MGSCLGKSGRMSIRKSYMHAPVQRPSAPGRIGRQQPGYFGSAALFCIRSRALRRRSLRSIIRSWALFTIGSVLAGSAAFGATAGIAPGLG